MPKSTHITVPVDLFYAWYTDLLQHTITYPGLSFQSQGYVLADERVKAALHAAFLKGMETAQQCHGQQQ